MCNATHAKLDIAFSSEQEAMKARSAAYRLGIRKVSLYAFTITAALSGWYVHIPLNQVRPEQVGRYSTELKREILSAVKTGGTASLVDNHLRTARTF